MNKAILIIGSIATIYACSHAQEPSASDKLEVKEVKVDTTVYSLPINYLESITDSSQKEIQSYKDLQNYWESMGYTLENWQSGKREIPRVFLVNIPHAWRMEVAPGIPVNEKKLIFFRGMAPLILRANERIMKDRNRLLSIRDRLVSNEELTPIDTSWTQALANVYKVELDWTAEETAQLNTLLEKVNIIPESLALAQAAIESGWGTSRFADEGNSIFGQWAWGSAAIKPESQRSGMGDYGIAAFESLQESVCSYMLNINTHHAYKALRDKRSQMENENQKLSGMVLCEQLNKYSERGWDYVKDLKNMMTHNHLVATDDAYLSKGPSVYVVPMND